MRSKYLLAAKLRSQSFFDRSKHAYLKGLVRFSQPALFERNGRAIKSWQFGGACKRDFQIERNFATGGINQDKVVTSFEAVDRLVHVVEPRKNGAFMHLIVHVG